MFRKKKLTLAVTAAATMASFGSINVHAQEDDALLEEVTIVGSRIPREISDAPSPVTVLDAVDIKLSGLENTADVLRQTVYNSFGSFRERSGSSFGQIAQVDLRGIGAEYTAVLINGRRVPGSPFTGTSAADLNTIPLSAIERMEILTDSASAIYGADAIGGVVNVVFKDDFDGFEFEIGGERPTEEGADSEHFSFLWGENFDRGNIMIGGEYFDREAISDADRDYSRASVFGTSFNDTEGVSVGGNTGFTPAFDEAFPLGTCDESLYAGVLTDPFGVPGSGCGFAYANISLQTGNLERKSLFLNADYQINDQTEVYVNTRYTNNETSGRYAPAVGFFPVPASSPFNTRGEDFDAFHRFVGHGNRNDTNDIEEIDIVLGVEGKIGDTSINYDVYAQAYNYQSDSRGNTYVQASASAAAVAEGRYDVFNPLSTDPVHLAAVEETGIELTRDIETDYYAFGANIDGQAFGDSAWSAGFEWADEEYQDIYDEFRENFDVLGSSGNSASGERSRWAVFGEYNWAVTSDWEVIGAARYDDFDDFGSEFSPQIMTRYSPHEYLTFRASVGEGFKAPSLTNLNASLQESFDDITDLYRCEAQLAAGQLADISECPTFQVRNFQGGNPDLEAESSESFNIGAIFDNGTFSASVDFYNIEIENIVTELSLAQVNTREADGALPSGTVVTRGASSVVNGVTIPGAIIDIENPFTNGAVLEIEGLDIRTNLSLDSDFGTWDLGMQWSHLLTYDEKTASDVPTEDLLDSEDGNTGYPEDRINTNIRWSLDDLTVSWNTQYISSFENVSETARYASWVSHDLTLNWFEPFGAKGFEVTAGVKNVTNREASIDPDGGYNDSVVLQLYSVAGRVPFLTFNYRFGE